MALLGKFKNALLVVVDLINEIGTPVTYTPKESGTPVVIKALIRELGNAELVGDFRQGDLRLEIDAAAIADEPKKYDRVEIQGKVYSVRSPSGSARHVGELVYTYKFIVRGA